MEPSKVRPSYRVSKGNLATVAVFVTLSTMLTLLLVTLSEPNSVTRTKEAALKTNLFWMREALDQYYADKGKHPASLEALVEGRYLRTIPVDPFTRSADTWQTVFAKPDAGNPSAEPGISNVKSGSEETSLSRDRYSDW